MSIDGASEIGKKGGRVVRPRKESGTERGPDHISPRVTIEALPDIVLLDIFEFYGAAGFPNPCGPLPWPWNRLVHVCQRWRYVVFASPLRLDLRLRTSKAPVRKMLDVWPPLPIEIIDRKTPCDVENVIAALEHRNRVCSIWLFDLTSPQLGRLVPMMQEPFLALTHLQLRLPVGTASVLLPDMFLGGSAQRLRTLELSNIPFPGLPRLLLSATNLSSLRLVGIPHTGYISPEAMVTGLSALTRLTRLLIIFDSPASHPDRRGRRPPPLTRVVLPTLFTLTFRGDNEYLEDLISRIDAPRLNDLNIFFLNQLIFDISQLHQFISHTGMAKSYNRARLTFEGAAVCFSHHPEGTNTPKSLMGIMCSGIDWQVSCMAQICSQYSFFLPSIERLDICECDGRRWRSRWQVDSDETPWLELFRPFTAVRTLYISRLPQTSIVRALQELTGERAIEVLPALDGLYLESYRPSGPGQKAIEPFIAARQYSGHPVAVHRWKGP